MKKITCFDDLVKLPPATLILGKNIVCHNGPLEEWVEKNLIAILCPEGERYKSPIGNLIVPWKDDGKDLFFLVTFDVSPGGTSTSIYKDTVLTEKDDKAFGELYALEPHEAVDVLLVIQDKINQLRAGMVDVNRLIARTGMLK